MTFYLRQLLVRLVKQEDGTTAVEYAVLIAMILVLTIAAILNTGDVQQLLWFDTADRLEVIVP